VTRRKRRKRRRRRRRRPGRPLKRLLEGYNPEAETGHLLVQLSKQTSRRKKTKKKKLSPRNLEWKYLR
jgi:hypothetical protein